MAQTAHRRICGRTGEAPQRQETAERLQAAQRFLCDHARFGRRADLVRMRVLLDKLGRPDRALRHVIHVGGTNGKGSVAAYIAAALRAAGFSVLRFTSPHLRDVRERIQVDGRPLDGATFAGLLLERIRPAAAAAAEACGEPPVFFELLTALAYEAARVRGVDAVVQEVGLGGRLDATNVIERPRVTVLTNVALDHAAQLGATIPEIAAEKAGIIKAGVPVVTAAAGEAAAVFRARAQALHSPFHRLDPAMVTTLASDLSGSRFLLRSPLRPEPLELSTPLAGRFQATNAALAALALQVAAQAVEGWATALTDEAIARGIAATRWPGRMSYIDDEPPWLIDGAHNAAAMAELAAETGRLFPDRRPLLLVACGREKSPSALFAPWLSASLPPRAWWTVPLASDRLLPADALAAELARAGAQPVQALSPVQAGAAAVKRKLQEEGLTTARTVVVVCGSLYLAGAACGWHGLSA